MTALNRTVRTEEADFEEKDPTGRYVRYGEILGRGAFKTVYKAFDEVEGIEVAWSQVDIDDVLQSPQQLERLYSEVHLLQTLKHENIIKLYYYWVDDKNRTINMITELFTSGSLRQYRKKHKNVDNKAIKKWARQILRGLQYLHNHSPSIIHRDLKCDNIFINGNTGEVKIGDLGLAIVMQQPPARSVIGTPEFMAPELYDEEYNELIDIYSFGMCMLELATCEYPYNECKNPAQIYKKVTSGIMPASLSKVVDPQVKLFIEKCLVPASMRTSAIELLKDPFLACEILQEPILKPLHSFNSISVPLEQEAPITVHMDVDLDNKKLSVSTCTKTSHKGNFSNLDFIRRSESNEFRLAGYQVNENCISLTVRVANSAGNVEYIHFEFDLGRDTIQLIVDEMDQQFNLTDEDMTLISDLLNCFIIKIIPGWRPEAYSSASSYGETLLDCPVGYDSAASSSLEQHVSEPSDAVNKPVSESNGYDDVHMDLEEEEEVDDADCCLASEKMQGNGTGESVMTEYYYLNSSSCTSYDMSLSSLCSFSALSFKDHNVDADLKVEIDALDSQNHHSYRDDLFELQEEATVEDAEN